MQAFPMLHTLEIRMISSSALSQNVASFLSSLVHLTDLRLHYSGMKRTKLKLQLQSCRSLKRLSLENVNDSEWESIFTATTHLHGLTDLSLSRVFSRYGDGKTKAPRTINWSACFAALCGLVSFKVQNVFGIDLLLAAIAQHCKSLEHLHFEPRWFVDGADTFLRQNRFNNSNSIPTADEATPLLMALVAELLISIPGLKTCAIELPPVESFRARHLLDDVDNIASYQEFNARVKKARAEFVLAVQQLISRDARVQMIESNSHTVYNLAQK